MSDLLLSQPVVAQQAVGLVHQQAVSVGQVQAPLAGAPPRSGNSAGFRVGKLPANWNKMKIGQEKLCGKWQSGKCPNQTKSDCMVGQKKFLHVCAIVLRLPSKPGNPPRLCGGNHLPTICPNKA